MMKQTQTEKIIGANQHQFVDAHLGGLRRAELIADGIGRIACFLIQRIEVLTVNSKGSLELLVLLEMVAGIKDRTDQPGQHQCEQQMFARCSGDEEADHTKQNPARKPA